MLIGAISAMGMPREPHACNDDAAVDRQEFEAAPKLPSREGFTNRDRLTDDELGVLHERGLVDDTHESLKTLFHAVVIPTIIGCPACAGGNIFWYDNRHA
jgi:hypothetical protein